MVRMTLAAAALLMGLALSAAIAAEDDARYARCAAEAERDAVAALREAEAWGKRGGGLAARHCAAMARFALHEYRTAAGELQALAAEPGAGPLQRDLLQQAAQAWSLASEPGLAEAALDAALKLAPNDAALLVDRALLHAEAGRLAKAKDDLDRVLAADPGHPEALVLRAAAKRRLNDLKGALADAERAVAAAPDSADARLERGNTRHLLGNAAGAREDWQRVVTLAPRSQAAQAARANLDTETRSQKARSQKTK